MDGEASLDRQWRIGSLRTRGAHKRWAAQGGPGFSAQSRWTQKALVMAAPASDAKLRGRRLKGNHRSAGHPLTKKTRRQGGRRPGHYGHHLGVE